MTSEIYDIAIIGGGINGCGIARDAAGRGLSVFLAEQHDLASGTSSASTKLIHGGLRYLEHYEFQLVRESLQERETLWAMAPHLIAPLRFVLPHHKNLRPAWLIRLGLFLYDHLGGRKRLPASRGFVLNQNDVGAPLKPSFTRAFEYSDCRVDDARLVVLNAMDAADRGAHIHVRTKVVSASRISSTPGTNSTSGIDDVWTVETKNEITGKTASIKARILINASGPWVSDVIGVVNSTHVPSTAKLVKGSHIVVPSQFSHDKAYIFQNADDRIIFAIPYEEDFTLIGTTDIDYQGDPAAASISEQEIDYLCNAANEYFTRQIAAPDVVWSYAGVRPLYDNGAGSAQKTTRDYVLDVDKSGHPETAVALNIFGGKITTYRYLAEDVLKKLAPWLPRKTAPWTAGQPLPGGDFPVDAVPEVAATLRAQYPNLDGRLLTRLSRSYGTRAQHILGDKIAMSDLGTHFGADLYQCEVAYLMAEEWAITADDILWRRSKLGLRLFDQEVRDLEDWMNNNQAQADRNVA